MSMLAVAVGCMLGSALYDAGRLALVWLKGRRAWRKKVEAFRAALAASADLHPECGRPYSEHVVEVTAYGAAARCPGRVKQVKVDVSVPN